MNRRRLLDRIEGGLVSAMGAFMLVTVLGIAVLRLLGVRGSVLVWVVLLLPVALCIAVFVITLLRERSGGH